MPQSDGPVAERVSAARSQREASLPQLQTQLDQNGQNSKQQLANAQAALTDLEQQLTSAQAALADSKRQLESAQADSLRDHASIHDLKQQLASAEAAVDNQRERSVAAIAEQKNVQESADKVIAGSTPSSARGRGLALGDVRPHQLSDDLRDRSISLAATLSNLSRNSGSVRISGERRSCRSR